MKGRCNGGSEQFSIQHQNPKGHLTIFIFVQKEISIVPPINVCILQRNKVCIQLLTPCL